LSFHGTNFFVDHGIGKGSESLHQASHFQKGEQQQ